MGAQPPAGKHNRQGRKKRWAAGGEKGEGEIPQCPRAGDGVRTCGEGLEGSTGSLLRPPVLRPTNGNELGVGHGPTRFAKSENPLEENKWTTKSEGPSAVSVGSRKPTNNPTGQGYERRQVLPLGPASLQRGQPLSGHSGLASACRATVVGAAGLAGSQVQHTSSAPHASSLPP